MKDKKIIVPLVIYVLVGVLGALSVINNYYQAAGILVINGILSVLIAKNTFDISKKQKEKLLGLRFTKSFFENFSLTKTPEKAYQASRMYLDELGLNLEYETFSQNAGKIFAGLNSQALASFVATKDYPKDCKKNIEEAEYEIELAQKQSLEDTLIKLIYQCIFLNIFIIAIRLIFGGTLLNYQSLDYQIFYDIVQVIPLLLCFMLTNERRKEDEKYI